MTIDVRTFLCRGKPLLISHWDADGLCSAAKIRKYVNPEAIYYTPPIGRYDVPIDEVEDLMPFDNIVVLDLAVRDDILGVVRERFDIDIIVIDHHYHSIKENAIYLDYPMDSGRRFYSNTLLLDDVIELDMDILTILGLIGDLGFHVKSLDLYSEVKSILERYSLSFEDAYKAVLLIDSNHIVNDRRAAEKAVEKIVDYTEEPIEMLDDAEWNKNYSSIKSEIDRLSTDSELEVFGRVVFKEFSSPYYIISRVGRRISNRYLDKVTVIVNTGFFKDHDQVYIRNNGLEINLFNIIKYALDRGYIAGGKYEAMGVIIPKRDASSFIDYLLHYIS